MKRSGFKQKIRKPMKRTKIRVVGHSDAAIKKQDIQDIMRLIVTRRDGGCVLRDVRHCNGLATVMNAKVVSDVVIQADHLVTRANMATFSDTRLIVCLCKGCHAWKHWHKEEYDDLVKTVLSKKTIELWDKCEEDRRSHKTYKLDLSLAMVALNKELTHYERNQAT